MCWESVFDRGSANRVLSDSAAFLLLLRLPGAKLEAIVRAAPASPWQRAS